MFAANFLITVRREGVGTRSVFDYGTSDNVGPFETIEEALAAGLAARSAAVARDPYSYEADWLVIEVDETGEIVLDVTAGQCDAVLAGMQDAAGLLAFKAEQEARWAEQAAETRRVLSLAGSSTDEIPF